MRTGRAIQLSPAFEQWLAMWAPRIWPHVRRAKRVCRAQLGQITGQIGERYASEQMADYYPAQDARRT